jgi:hypothetical protein
METTINQENYEDHEKYDGYLLFQVIPSGNFDYAPYDVVKGKFKFLTNAIEQAKKLCKNKNFIGEYYIKGFYYNDKEIENKKDKVLFKIKSSQKKAYYYEKSSDDYISSDSC